MNRRRLPLLVLVLLLLVALGALQGARVRQLRESEAFYRWMLAAAVNERLFQEDDGEYKDRELFERCNREAGELAGLIGPAKDGEGGVSPLGAASGRIENDASLWRIARSGELAGARTEFLSLARDRKLRFAMDIQYAEAQASGVGVFNVFFGFRKVAANFLWIQVDRYWHQGNMHRMIALMKTCTTLDPHFIEAYLIGAWHISYNATAKMMDTPWPLREWDGRYQACVGEKERYYQLAIEFLKDGIRKNPRNYKVYFDLGFAVYKQKLKDYPNAVKYLGEAIRQPHDRWVPRQLFICQELNGQYEEALAGWKDYMKRFPDSDLTTDVAPRFIKRNEAMMVQQRAEAALREAEGASDPAGAEQKRAEAKKLRDEARNIWGIVGEKEGVARVLLLDAAELHEQQRYIEAVALLDKARWESAEVWDQASDLIMKYKQEGKIPLSISELKALERRKEEGICRGMPEDVKQRILESNAKKVL